MSLGFGLVALAGLGVIVASLALGDGHDHDAGDGDHGLNILSVRAVSLMVTMFGVAGFLVSWYGMSPLPASGVGTIAGVGAGFLYTLGMRALAGQQASSMILDKDVVGSDGIVTTSIPSDGIGEVQCYVAGRTLTLMARSGSGPIPSGTAVRVINKVGATVSVKPAA